MKQILTYIFVTLGVIFLLLIMVAIYFFVTDPYNLKPLIFGITPTTVEKQTTTADTKTTITPEPLSEDSSVTEPSAGFTLSAEQKQALIAVGVDPASIPSSISAEQEECFTEALGASRVMEIKAGAVPSALEFLRAKSCI